MEKPRGLNIVAIVIGSAADIGGTMAVSGIVGVGLVAALLAQGAHPIDIEDKVADMQQEPLFLAGSLAIGLGFTALGGFLAAWFARHARLLHAGIVGTISTLIGLGFAPATPNPDWYTVTALASTIPAALLGGLLAPPPKMLADDADDFYET